MYLLNAYVLFIAEVLEALTLVAKNDKQVTTATQVYPTSNPRNGNYGKKSPSNALLKNSEGSSQIQSMCIVIKNIESIFQMWDF